MNIKEFSSGLLDSLVHKAGRSIRKRQHLNIHHSHDEYCQRLFNAIDPGSYIRPHRHSVDPKTEDLIAIRGAFALVLFSDTGGFENIVRFGTEKYEGSGGMSVGVELPPHVWHTVVALTDGAILLELKEGPFRPDAAKEFAPWAPDEGTAESAQYVQSLRLAIQNWPEPSAMPCDAALA